MENVEPELQQGEVENVKARDPSVQLIGYSAEAVRAPRNREEALELSAKVLERAFSPRRRRPVST